MFGALVLAMSCGAGQAAIQPQQQLAELVDLDLEQLTRVTVTSVSKREERLVDAAASVFVITAEDIRRAGVTSLPEALRLAPNLLVVRSDTSQYIVSARSGLSGSANKMLVLMDGRTVYTPLFSGVFYDALTVMMEDVDRIEVISGPGSTLWGTNAVNGVINVISKSARRTQGGLLAGGAGDQEKGGSARYGWSSGSNGSVRAYARYFERGEHRLASGASAMDGASRWQAGLRGDWDQASHSATLQGDVYGTNVGNLGGARDLSGGNVLGRWRANLGGDSSLVLQGYYDRTEREHAGSFKEARDTLDAEVQHTSRPWSTHRIAFGGGYRASRDKTEATPVLGFIPAGRTLTLASLFAQDEIALAANLRATLGLRTERYTYSGVEWLPNARLSYSLTADDVLWAAVTRTVRSPSRIDRDLVVPGMPPFVITQNDAFQPEIANVAEVGYRGNLGHALSLSFTGFHHRFKQLRTLEPLGASQVLANGAEGRVSGLEGWGDFRPFTDWRLLLGFTLLREKTEILPGRVNLTEAPLGNNPRRTALLRSLWNVTPSTQLDLMLRYVGALPNPAVPAYTELNARLGWRVSRSLELALVVMNALDRDHAEFGAPAVRAVFESSYFVRAAWTF
ncbi:MAG: TonB-dependent receptor [Usitatibacter sp.]